MINMMRSHLISLLLILFIIVLIAYVIFINSFTFLINIMKTVQC